MEIRPLYLADYDALYELWTACSGMGLNNLDDSREGIARFLARNPDSCFAAAASRPVDWADSATEETSRCISSLAREVNRASNTKAAATVQISSPRPSTSAMLILIFFFICQISSGRGQPWLLAPIKR